MPDQSLDSLGGSFILSSEVRDRSSHWHRFELKYMVDAETASRLAGFCATHIPRDPYTKSGGYPIQSIYLDSPQHHCYRDAIDRRTSRFKLRARTYDGLYDVPGEGPAFLEIKRKTSGIIAKTRSRLSKSSAETLVWNEIPMVTSLPEDEPGDATLLTVNNVNEFLCLKNSIRATPVVSVYYEREAYESTTSDQVRITFDRNLHLGQLRRGHRPIWWPIHTSGVIVEIKFTTTYPDWLAHAIRTFELNRRGICKYAICFEALFGRHTLKVS